MNENPVEQAVHEMQQAHPNLSNIERVAVVAGNNWEPVVGMSHEVRGNMQVVVAITQVDDGLWVVGTVE